MSRYSESNEEEMRKDVTRNIKKNLKANPSYKIARFVDQPVLEKTVLSQYGTFRRNMSRVGTVDGIEKARSTYGNSVYQNKLRVSEIPQEMSVEEAYYNIMGKGIDGREVPTAMHQSYVCPKCGLKQVMDLGVMDLDCPRCKHRTPIGELVDAGAHTRW